MMVSSNEIETNIEAYKSLRRLLEFLNSYKKYERLLMVHSNKLAA